MAGGRRKRRQPACQRRCEDVHHDATIAQREYDMGYKSVQLLKLMTEKGVEAALAEMGAVDGVIDTGVDVVTAANLKDYEVALDAKGIPHEWHAP